VCRSCVCVRVRVCVCVCHTVISRMNEQMCSVSTGHTRLDVMSHVTSCVIQSCPYERADVYLLIIHV